MAPVRKGSQWTKPEKDETALLPTGDREMTYKKSTGETTGERDTVRPSFNNKRADIVKDIVQKKKMTDDSKTEDAVMAPLKEQIKKSISKK